MTLQVGNALFYPKKKLLYTIVIDSLLTKAIYKNKI